VPSIQANTPVITQINVFTVPENGQQALIELLTGAARFASTTAGWISASVHRACRFDPPRVGSVGLGQRVNHQRLGCSPIDHRQLDSAAQ
jgi:hypothetical protein